MSAYPTPDWPTEWIKLGPKVAVELDEAKRLLARWLADEMGDEIAVETRAFLAKNLPQ